MAKKYMETSSRRIRGPSCWVFKFILMIWYESDDGSKEYPFEENPDMRHEMCFIALGFEDAIKKLHGRISTVFNRTSSERQWLTKYYVHEIDRCGYLIWDNHEIEQLFNNHHGI